MLKMLFRRKTLVPSLQGFQNDSYRVRRLRRELKAERRGKLAPFAH